LKKYLLIIARDYKGATKSFEHSTKIKKAISESFYQQVMDILIFQYLSAVEIIKVVLIKYQLYSSLN